MFWVDIFSVSPLLDEKNLWLLQKTFTTNIWLWGETDVLDFSL